MAQLIGLARVGRDVELRYTGNGDPVANVSLAFNYGRKGEDGNKPTQWVDASLWNKRAESLAEHLTSGTQVFAVIDDIHIETYETRDGKVGSKLVGTISHIEFASSGNREGRQDSGDQQRSNRGEGQQRGGQQRQQPQQRQQQGSRGGYGGGQQGNAPRQGQQRQGQQPQGGSSGFDDFDDSIPF